MDRGVSRVVDLQELVIEGHLPSRAHSNLLSGRAETHTKLVHCNHGKLLWFVSVASGARLGDGRWADRAFSNLADEEGRSWVVFLDGGRTAAARCAQRGSERASNGTVVQGM